MSKSKLRSETSPAIHGEYCPQGPLAYLVIHNAVKDMDGLIHGKLDGPRGEHCAIGSYFARNPRTALDTALIDEIAAVNDSVPRASNRERKRVVLRYLRWKLHSLGLPGVAPRVKAKAR